MRYKSKSSLALVAGMLWAIAPQTVMALSFSIIPLASDPGGQSAEASAQDWSEWVYSFDQVADGGDPVTDTTGEFQTQKQGFPVYFLGGAGTTGIERSFRVAPGAIFFVPLLNLTCVGPEPDFSCLDPAVDDFIEGFMDNTDSLSLSIDGTSVIDASNSAEVDAIEADYRVRTDVFSLILAPNNLSGSPAGTYNESFNTGFYTAFTLDRGQHVVEYGGSSSGFSNSVRANINVVPIPPTLGLLAGSMLLLGGIRASRRHSVK